MRLLTTKEAAARLSVSPEFLERDRWAGGTIPFIRIGKRVVRYTEEDLAAYLQDRRQTPASALTIEPRERGSAKQRGGCDVA